MIINIPQGQSLKCEEYHDEMGNPTGKSVIITPLRVTMVTAESYKVSFGCNMWKSCCNENCSYCQAGMGSYLEPKP